MKNLFSFLSLFILTLSLHAQDLIVMKNGDMVEAKVLELQLEQIKYKRFNHQDGPTISVAKEEVFFIKYENGAKEVISSLDQTKHNQTQKNLSSQTPTNNEHTAASTNYKKEEVRSQKIEPTRPSRPKHDYVVYAGGSIPMADLKDEYYFNTKPGFSLGLENTTWFSDNFGWIGHISLTHNKGSEEDYDNGAITNIWGLSGIQFSNFSNNSSARGHLSIMIGGNFLATSGEVSEEYESSWSLAAGIGAGIVINEQIDISSRFVVAPHSYEDYYGDITLTALVIQLGIGYRF